VPAPTVVEICGVLQSVCRAEGISLPEQLASRVAQASGRNLRKAILMLEACKVSTISISNLQNYSVQWCVVCQIYCAVVLRALQQACASLHVAMSLLLPCWVSSVASKPGFSYSCLCAVVLIKHQSVYDL
jgi:hypothetical protein